MRIDATGGLKAADDAYTEEDEQQRQYLEGAMDDYYAGGEADEAGNDSTDWESEEEDDLGEGESVAAIVSRIESRLAKADLTMHKYVTSSFR